MIQPALGPRLFVRLLAILTLTIGIPALLLLGAAVAFLDRLAERQTVVATSVPWHVFTAHPEWVTNGMAASSPFLDPALTVTAPLRSPAFLDTLPPSARMALERGTDWSGVIKPLGQAAAAVHLGPHPVDPAYALVLKGPIPSRSEFAGNLLPEMTWILAVLILASISLTVLLLGRRIAPLSAFPIALRQVAAGKALGEPETAGVREYQEMAAAMAGVLDRTEGIVAEMTSARERLLAILSQTQERVAVLDQEGRVLYANPSLTRMFNMGPERARPPFHWECLRHPPLQEELEGFLRALLRPPVSPRHFRLDYDGRHYQGSLSHLVKARGAMLTLTDITEAVDLAETKRTLVANVSHELNTPLTSIKGFSETLEAGETDPDRLAQWAILKRNTERLIALVKDLLTLSKLEQGGLPQHREAVYVATWLDELRTLMEPRAAAKSVTLIVRVDGSLPPLWADPFQLEQVGVNLLDNALKYTETGTIAIHALADTDRVVLTFRDSGPGIPPGHEDRVFERFYVVDPSRARHLGGTGLGLSIVKHIVTAHGGTITAGNHPEGGAMFTLALPVKPIPTA